MYITRSCNRTFFLRFFFAFLRDEVACSRVPHVPAITSPLRRPGLSVVPGLDIDLPLRRIPLPCCGPQPSHSAASSTTVNHSGLISQGAFPLRASPPKQTLSGYVDRTSPLWQEKASRDMEAIIRQFGPKKTKLCNEIWAPSGRNSALG